MIKITDCLIIVIRYIALHIDITCIFTLTDGGHRLEKITLNEKSALFAPVRVTHAQGVPFAAWRKKGTHKITERDYSVPLSHSRYSLNQSAAFIVINQSNLLRL